MRDAGHDAFVTYTQRAEHDRAVARAVQHGLHRMAKPFYRLRAMDVFRDETSLAQTNELSKSLRDHLARSDYLLVVASRSSATSDWVRLETQEWIRLGRIDRLIIILVDGHLRWDPAAQRFDPGTDCLTPVILETPWADQPFIIDLSAISTGELVLRNPTFALSMAKVAARIRGTEPFLLISEDVTQHRRTMVAAWGASLAIVALVAIVSSLYLSEQAARKSAELRLADSWVFQSREYAARRQWRQASEVLGQAWDSYRSLDRSPLLAAFATWLVERERRSPAAQLQFQGRRFSAVAVDCSSRILLAGDQVGRLVAWQLDEQTSTEAIDQHQARVSEIRAAAGVIFSAGYDGRLLQWNPKDSPPIAIELLQLPGKAISAMDVSADGTRFVLGLSDGSLAEFDRRSNKRTIWRAHGGEVSAVRISEDGTYIVSTSKDNTARTWHRQASGWELAYPPLRQPGPVQDVALLDGLNWAFVANANGSVAAIKNEAGGQVRAPNAPLEGAMSVAVRGDFGVTGDFSGGLHMWDVASGAPVAELVAHRGAVLAMSFACTDEQLITAGTDGLLALWSMSTSAVAWGPRVDAQSRVLLLPAGDKAMLIRADGRIDLFDARTWNEIEKGEKPWGAVSAAALSPDGETLAISKYNGQVDIFDANAGRPTYRATIQASNREIRDLAVSNSARLVAWVDDASEVVAWSAGQAPSRRPLQYAAQVGVTLSPETVLVGTKQGSVFALDAATLANDRLLAKHETAVSWVSHTLDARHVLTGDAAGNVRVSPVSGSISDGKALLLRPPERVGSADALGQVVAMTQADEGRLVVAVTSGFRVGVWELDYQRNLFARPETIYPGFNTGLRSAAIARDGRTIVALTEDGRLLSLILPERVGRPPAP